jgi:hypothetical protein
MNRTVIGFSIGGAFALAGMMLILTAHAWATH